MTRAERERFVIVLIDLCEPVPTWVLKDCETKEEAEKYVSDIKNSNNIIENI